MLTVVLRLEDDFLCSGLVFLKGIEFVCLRTTRRTFTRWPGTVTCDPWQLSFARRLVGGFHGAATASRFTRTAPDLMVNGGTARCEDFRGCPVTGLRDCHRAPGFCKRLHSGTLWMAGHRP